MYAIHKVMYAIHNFMYAIHKVMYAIHVTNSGRKAMNGSILNKLIVKIAREIIFCTIEPLSNL